MPNLFHFAPEVCLEPCLKANAMLALQSLTYEALAILGPVWSAVLAGFAVFILGELYLTPAGQAYLDSLED